MYKLSRLWHISLLKWKSPYSSPIFSFIFLFLVTVQVCFNSKKNFVVQLQVTLWITMVTATNCKWLLGKNTKSALCTIYRVYVQNSVRNQTAQQIIIFKFSTSSLKMRDDVTISIVIITNMQMNKI